MRRLFIILIIGFCIVLQVAPPPVLAITQSALDAINGHYPDYDPSDLATGCRSGSLASAISNVLPKTVPAAYANLFSQAAAVYKINPQFLAALFLDEHGNAWLPFTGPWASSSVGASGPFQFMPGTWIGYKVDGNNDGVIDIQNIYDATYSAANMISKNGVTTSTPLGSLDKPFVPGTFIYFSAVYNWGGGNVLSTNPSSPLSAAPNETQNYMTNTYAVISSAFTNGSTANGAVKDQSGSQTVSSTTTAALAGNGCSAGVVAGGVVQTALNLAWDNGGHGREETDAKAEYQTAMSTFNGSTTDYPYSDCGVFVSTVYIASGADKSYPKRNTITQKAYLESSPKYTRILATKTSDLAAGDIFINSEHTYIYVGPQSKGYSIVAASLRDHVPEANGTPYFFQNGTTGEQFEIFRLKG